MVPIEFRHHMSRIGAITHSSHREEAVEPEVGDLEPPGTTVRRVQGVPLPSTPTPGDGLDHILWWHRAAPSPIWRQGHDWTLRGHRRDKTASELDPAESMISNSPDEPS